MKELFKGCLSMLRLLFWCFCSFLMPTLFFPCAEAGSAKAQTMKSDQPPHAGIMDILESTLLEGGAQRSRLFFDPKTGIQFWVPWASYLFKKPKQIESLVLSRTSLSEAPGGVLIGGFFPTSAHQTLLKKEAFRVDFAPLTNALPPPEKKTQTPSDSQEGEVVAYLPYLVFWFHEVSELEESRDFRHLVKTILGHQNDGPFDRVFRMPLAIERHARMALAQVAQVMGLAATQSIENPPQGTTWSMVQGRTRWKKNQAILLYEERGGLRRKVLLQGIRGRLLAFALFYNKPSEGQILDKVALSLRLQKASELTPSGQGIVGSWTASFLGIFGLCILTGLFWWAFRWKKVRQARIS